MPAEGMGADGLVFAEGIAAEGIGVMRDGPLVAVDWGYPFAGGETLALFSGGIGSDSIEE